MINGAFLVEQGLHFLYRSEAKEFVPKGTERKVLPKISSAKFGSKPRSLVDAVNIWGELYSNCLGSLHRRI